MTAAEQWAANQRFLDRAIAQHAEFRLATSLDKVRKGSWLEKEIQYLLRNGYDLTTDGKGLVYMSDDNVNDRRMSAKKTEPGSLEEEILTELETLYRSFSFILQSQRYDPKHFGNADLILKKRQLLVRLLRDRNEKYVELTLSSRPDEWHSLDTVLEAMGKFGPDQLLPSSWDALVQLFTNNVDEIERFLSGPGNASVKALEHSKARRRLVELMGDRTKRD